MISGGKSIYYENQRESGKLKKGHVHGVASDV